MQAGITNSAANLIGELQISNSITVNSANPNAIDRDNPLSFLDWIKYFTGVQSDPRILLQNYKQYIISWQQVNQGTTTDYIQSLYTSLLQNIAVNFLAQEERRFVNNADYSDPTQVAAIVPMFVRKIKDICLYYASVREEVKSTPYKYNLRTSNYALQKTIAETINNSFLDPEINKLFVEEGITPDSIKQTLSISFDELYDTETNYYDINSTLPASAYDATGRRLEYFGSNEYDLEPELFIDFDASIVKQIQQYPVILNTLGSNFAVNFPVTSNDLQFLKDQDFTNLVNTLNVDNLNINYLKQALETFSGTTFYYLSTNNESQFNYGLLFEANAFSNYLNRRFPTIAQVDSDKLETIQSIGGFFKPEKNGIQNFQAFNINGSIQSLSANTIYIFPDPNIYGNITGLSRSSFDNPFSYIEDVTSFKNNYTNTAGFGYALTDFIAKFKGYQSRSESLNYDPTGVSRASDSYEYFKGPKKTVWNNDDVFPRNSTNYLPIQAKTEYLLYTNNLTQVQLKHDLNGNSFGLYKEVYAAKDPATVRTNALGGVIYCQEFDCNQFFTASGGTWNLPASGVLTLDAGSASFGYTSSYTAVLALNNSVFTGSTQLSSSYGVSGIYVDQSISVTNYGYITAYNATLSSAFTPYFINTQWQYNLQSVLFYPELDFCKTDPIYVFDRVSDSQAFNAPTALYALFPYVNFIDYAYPDTYVSNTINAIVSTGGVLFRNFPLTGYGYSDCGPFLNKGVDASPISIQRNYSAPNTYFNTVLSEAATTFDSNSGTLANNISLYDQYDIYGTIYYRSADNTKVLPASAILNSIFVKYPAGIQNEVYNYTKYFDIINTTLVVETSSYIIFEALNYDYNTSTYLTIGNTLNYIVKDNNNPYSQFSNTWYDEIADVIYVAKTDVVPQASATNSRAIYFDLYKYDGSTLNKIFTPLNSNIITSSYFSLSTLTGYTTAGYVSFINFTAIERPVLSYGYDTGKYNLKYIGKDSSNMFYTVDFTYKIGTNIYDLSGNIYIPDMFLHSENFGNTVFSSFASTKTLAPFTTAALTLSSNYLLF